MMYTPSQSLATTLCALLLSVSAFTGPTAAQPASSTNIAALAPASPAAVDEVNKEMAMWTRKVDAIRARLVKQDGYLKLPGNVIDVLIFDRKLGHQMLRERYELRFTSAGMMMPNDFFAALDASLDSLWKEIDRLAPSYSVPSDATPAGKLEQTVRTQIRGTIPDAEVLATYTLSEGYAVGENSAGLGVSRRSNGIVLYRVPQVQWVVCREFTLDKPYTGRIAEASSDIRFGAVRFQK